MITRKSLFLSSIPLLLFLAGLIPQVASANNTGGSPPQDNFDEYTPTGSAIDTYTGSIWNGTFFGAGTITSGSCVSGNCLSSGGNNGRETTTWTGNQVGFASGASTVEVAYGSGTQTGGGIIFGQNTVDAGYSQLGYASISFNPSGVTAYVGTSSANAISVGSIPDDMTWHSITFNWLIEPNIVGAPVCEATVSIDGGTAVDITASSPNTDRWCIHDDSTLLPFVSYGVNAVTLYGNSTFATVLFDNLNTTGTTPAPGDNTTTHIQTVTPASGSTNATSTSFTFGATGFVAPTDYIAGHTNVTVSFSNAGFASSQMVGPIGAELQQPDNSQTFTFPVTASGAFSFSTTTGVQIIGNYTLNTAITVPRYNFLGITLFTNTLVATSTTFIVATSTAYGTLQQAVAQQYQQLINTASSTIDTTVCNPISGNFNITGCLVVVFGFPSQVDLNNAYTQFQTNVATHQPWGYFNRFFTILTYDGTSTLPSYTAYIATDASTTEDVISINPGDMIAGAGSLLNNVKDPQNGLTIRQIMEPYILLMVALGVLFTILADLLGSHRHNQNQYHGQKSSRRV